MADLLPLIFLFPLLGFFNSGQKWWELCAEEYHNIGWGFRYAWGLFDAKQLDDLHRAQLAAYEHYFWFFGVLPGMIIQGIAAFFIVKEIVPQLALMAAVFFFLFGFSIINSVRYLMNGGGLPNPTNPNYGNDSLLNLFHALANVFRNFKWQDVDKAFSIFQAAARLVIVVFFALSVVFMAYHGSITGDMLIGTIKSLLSSAGV